MQVVILALSCTNDSPFSSSYYGVPSVRAKFRVFTYLFLYLCFTQESSRTFPIINTSFEESSSSLSELRFLDDDLEDHGFVEDEVTSTLEDHRVNPI